MSSDGTLFGSDLVNADLVTFNTSTGAATVIGSFNGPTERSMEPTTTERSTKSIK